MMAMAADRPAAPPPMITTSYSFMPEASSLMRANDNRCCCFRELRCPMGTVTAQAGRRATGRMRPDAPGGPAIAAALDKVGPRLRGVREQRGFTLTVAAEHAGISKSTLSRLENGQRRPSLELLLPLAQMYRVPIEDLLRARDHGVSVSYLQGLAEAGYKGLPLDEVVRMRDHGVTSAFIRRVSTANGAENGRLEPDQLIRLRDRGAY